MVTRFSAIFVLLSLVGVALPTIANAQYGGGGPPVGLFGTFTPPPTVPAPTAPAGQVLGAAVYNFTTNFGLGSSDPDVTALQQFLATAGFYGGPITGNFGPVTKLAVKLFQKANNISPVSGYVGPLTRGLLNEGNNPTSAQEQSSILSNLYSELEQALTRLKNWSAST